MNAECIEAEKQIKRRRTGEFSKSQEGQLRVKTLGGEKVISLSIEEAHGLTVATLRKMVIKAAGIIEDVKLIVELRQLEEKESLEDLMAGMDPCEVLCITQPLPQFDPSLPALEQLNVLKGLLDSLSPDYNIQAAMQIRKLLSPEANPPIDAIIESGVLPRILELAQKSISPDVQLEALWVVANVGAGSNKHVRALVDLNSISILVGVLNTELKEWASKTAVIDQALWAVGNLAGENAHCRDACLAAGALSPILQILGRDEDPNCGVLCNAAWTFRNFCRGEPAPAFDQFLPALHTLKQLLNQEVTADVLTDVCWSLFYLTDTHDGIQALIEAGFPSRLIELLSHASPMVVRPAVCCMRNLVTESDSQIQAILDGGFLDAVKPLIEPSSRRAIRTEALLAISKICFGTFVQKQAVIDSGHIPKIISAMSSADHEVKKAATTCIAKICNSLHAGQFESLVSSGCVKPLLDLLSDGDDDVGTMALDSLHRILEVRDQVTGESLYKSTVRAVIEAHPEVTRRLEQLPWHCQWSICNTLFSC